MSDNYLKYRLYRKPVGEQLIRRESNGAVGPDEKEALDRFLQRNKALIQEGDTWYVTVDYDRLGAELAIFVIHEPRGFTIKRVND